MEKPTMTAEQEQRAVRLGALVVHLGALVLAVVLVGFGAWTLAAVTALVAAVAGAWALKLYGDLRDQAMQDRAMANAAGRFNRPPPPAEGGDPYSA
jgi:Na+-translocating ferredoxin:NAD+ oxidoreductase RnfD subunit